MEPAPHGWSISDMEYVWSLVPAVVATSASAYFLRVGFLVVLQRTGSCCVCFVVSFPQTTTRQPPQQGSSTRDHTTNPPCSGWRSRCRSSRDAQDDADPHHHRRAAAYWFRGLMLVAMASVMEPPPWILSSSHYNHNHTKTGGDGGSSSLCSVVRTNHTTKNQNLVPNTRMIMKDHHDDPMVFANDNRTSCLPDKHFQLGPGLQELIVGQDPQLREIIRAMPDLLRGPSPPLVFRNRHLQLLPWLIQNEVHRQHGIPYQRIPITVQDCLVKEPNCQPSPLMTDTITLDIFPPLMARSDQEKKNTTTTAHVLYPQFNASSSIILIAPGLRCKSQDIPGNMIVRRAYGAGFRTIVMNRRGHSTEHRLQAPRWNLFGDVQDLEQVYWYIRHELLHHQGADPHTPMFLHGVSAGVGLAAPTLGIWDQRRRDRPQVPTPSFVACILMAPGNYDIRRNYWPNRFRDPYNTHVLTPSVKDWFVRRNEELLRTHYGDEIVNAVLQAETMQDVIHSAVPMAGYRTASEYFGATNPINTFFETSTPYLVVHSKDDALINIMDFLADVSPLAHHEGRTYAELSALSERGLLAIAKTGSHCPFLDNAAAGYDGTSSASAMLRSLVPGLVQDPLYGGYMLDSWADRISIQYYQAALKVYHDRRFL